MNPNTGVFHIDHKRPVASQTLRERKALRAANERAGREFSEADHQRKIQKTEYWGGIAVGFLCGGPFWVLVSAVVFALVLGWTPHHGIVLR